MGKKSLSLLDATEYVSPCYKQNARNSWSLLIFNSLTIS